MWGRISKARRERKVVNLLQIVKKLPLGVATTHGELTTDSRLASTDDQEPGTGTPYCFAQRRYDSFACCCVVPGSWLGTRAAREVDDMSVTGIGGVFFRAGDPEALAAMRAADAALFGEWAEKCPVELPLLTID